MANRPTSYHGSAEELRRVREERNEVIRAWGRQQLADADAVLLGVPTESLDVSDWDQIDVPEEEEEVTSVAETPQLSPVPEEIVKAAQTDFPKAKPRSKVTPKPE